MSQTAFDVEDERNLARLFSLELQHEGVRRCDSGQTDAKDLNWHLRKISILFSWTYVA